ncbi:MAG TPA: NAD(P)/FAD-dependent oxidoreductase [Polyangiales bacterium]|nr:NAD(P)/FAD-dependent oxidoreductase [Polyangiales bacterium]
MANEYLDVLIVGAGLSGIGSAYHLQTECPNKSYAVLEGRDRSGGTWDLFRYPGIRSDSDMYTLGYVFKPWTNAKAIADGPSILSYVRETAREHGIDKKIRYQHRVKRVSWSSADARWTVEVDRGPEHAITRIECGFVFFATGYYDYDQGYTPELPGRERFQGRIVHPQHWTPDIDYAGKRVIVIGSGATAVTLVPTLAEQAAQVTMLQRSPTYVVSRPAEDPIANALRGRLPPKAAYEITRWKNVLLGMFFFNLSKKQPERVKSLMARGVRAALGKDYDMKHFTPTYNPWDQRVCLVPDGDLFRSIRKGKAEVVTDTIETFTERGILLKSGRELEADLIVTATGLNLVVLGKVEIAVDGRPIDPSQGMTYKGMMYSDVPNLAFAIGYTNASWTLKCDLTAQYVCRLLQHMDAAGKRVCLPHNDDPTVKLEPWIDFSSGYVLRSLDKFPKQGSKAPWKLHQNYARDTLALRFSKVDDGVMRFGNAAPRARERLGNGGRKLSWKSAVLTLRGPRDAD